MKYYENISISPHLYCDKLKAFISQNTKELELNILNDLTHLDEVATCTSGINIEEVTHLSENQYKLTYSYIYHIYNGCLDIDCSQSVQERIRFTLLKGGTLDFEYHTYADHGSGDEL